MTIKKKMERSVRAQGRLSVGDLISSKRVSQWARNGVGVEGGNSGGAGA